MRWTGSVEGANLSTPPSHRDERLLHDRHWTIGHNACKGAKTDLERTSLLTCKLCASDMTAADDTYDHTFHSCQHPLMCQARAESDGLLLTVPLLTDLDRRLFPVLLRLVQEVDGHRICMGNWFFVPDHPT